MPVAAMPLLRLRIQRRDTKIIVELHSGSIIISPYEVEVDAEFLRNLDARYPHLTLSGVRNPGTNEAVQHTGNLREVGASIFSRLLPKDIQQRLVETDPAYLNLELDEQLIHIPWELCFDGNDFIATKFAVGRQVISTTHESPASRAEAECLQILIVADPTGDLEGAAKEGEYLFNLLNGVPNVAVTLVGQGRIKTAAALLEMMQQYDIVHFAGHSSYDPQTPAKSGWRISKSEIVTVAALSNLQNPPRLVFSNSCLSGVTSSEDSHNPFAMPALGIGSAFLRAGVSNYIGTFWDGRDKESKHFAEAFYQKVVMGMSVGAALREARKEIRETEQIDGRDVTWASYMLYGDPRVKLLSDRKEQAKTILNIKSTRTKLDVSGRTLISAQSVNSEHNSISQIVFKYQGEVVDTSDEDLCALFPKIKEAVEAAAEIAKTLKSQSVRASTKPSLSYRIGIHLGPVVSQAGKTSGDGVTIASELAQLAKAGEIFVSELVYNQVKNRLRALKLEAAFVGNVKIPGIDERISVHRLLEQRYVSPPPIFWAIVLTCLAVIAWFIYAPRLPSSPTIQILRSCKTSLIKSPASTKPYTVVVLPFKNFKSGTNYNWMANAFAPRLTSELSRSKGLAVKTLGQITGGTEPYPPFSLDMATKHDITYMFTGDYFTDPTDQILDIVVNLTDVLRNTENMVVHVKVQPPDLSITISVLAAEMMKCLDVPLPISLSGTPPTQMAPLHSQEYFINVVEDQPEPAQEKDDPTLNLPLQKEEPHSWLWQLQEWLGIRSAWAQEPSRKVNNAEKELRDTLADYESAYNTWDWTKLANVYQSFTPAQREANEKYRQNTQNLQVTLSDIEISVDGDEAVVTYTREDEFVDTKTKQKVKLNARVTKIFVHTENGWKIKTRSH